MERWKTGPVKVPAPEPVLEETFGAKQLSFIPTGCTLLDCVIGGGWPIGRVSNIVGDRSTGKTLLAEEAMANFLRTYPNGNAWYRETEAAFDVSYAKCLGLNTDRINFGPDGPDTHWATIESLMDDVDSILNNHEEAVVKKAKELREKNKKLKPDKAEELAYQSAPPGLYIIDSLDAVSSEKELERDIHKGSYNMERQKLLSELFRKTCRRLRRARVAVIFISQTRANIGAMMNAKQYVRTGGKGLDFYASVVMYLADLGKVYRTIGQVKRPIAIHIKAKNDKNKITIPYRECEFDIRFAYGIEDDGASLDWLKKMDKLKEAGLDEMPKNLDDVDSKKLRANVIRIWNDIEKKFLPAKGKYVD